MDAPASAPSPARAADRPGKRPSLARRNTVRWIGAIAIALLLLAVGVGSWMTRTLEVVAPLGSSVAVMLPDGSRVELNSGSSIAYTAGLRGNERTVRLNGEAFFEVARAARPFVVETFNADVTVLGTRFNVRARRDEPTPATAVTVEHGRVRLASKRVATDAVELTPGWSARVSGPQALLSAADSVSLAPALAWRSGGLAFVDQPMAVIFGELERRYDVEISASNELLVRTQSYWKHDPADIRGVLGDLTQASGLRYRATARGYEVFVP